VTVLQFAGTIDESFDANGISTGLRDHLVIALADVGRITSFGIRNWLEFIGRASASCSSIWFVECAPRIIDQFNMVANFGGRGTIVSFFAAQRCLYCGAEHRRLFHTELDRELIQEQRLDGGSCPTDGNPLQFDDDPESYLGFVSNQPRVEVPAHVREVLERRGETAAPSTLRRTRVEKRIAGRFTFLALSGDLGMDLPVQKLAEGLEGDVVFDLGKVGAVSDEGRERWRGLVRAVAPSTERLLVLRLPFSLLQKLSRELDLGGKGHVLSVLLPFACRSCGVTSQLEVEIADHYDALRLGEPPRIACSQCGRPADSTITEELKLAFGELPPPDPSLRKADLLGLLVAPATDRRRDGAPAALPALPQAPAPAPVRRTNLGLLAVAAVLLLGLAGIAVALYTSGARSGPEERAMKPAVLERSAAAAPSWRGRGFAVRGEHAFVTGASGLVSSTVEGVSQARAAALEEVCQHVAGRIREPAWLEHVAGQYQSLRAKALEELERAYLANDLDAILAAEQRVIERRRLVAQAMAAGAPGLVEPSWQATYWEKLRTRQGVRYRVWSQFRMSKTEPRRLLDHYAARETALSMIAMSWFCGLAWRYGGRPEGAIVVAMNPDSPLRRIGVQLGDILISVRERTVKDARTFQRVVNEEHGDLQRTGGTMIIRLQRGDAPVVDYQLLVEAVASKRPERKGGTKPASDGSKLPPANIWDDNPYE
jgi:hypothetical protein